MAWIEEINVENSFLQFYTIKSNDDVKFICIDST